MTFPSGWRRGGFSLSCPGNTDAGLKQAGLLPTLSPGPAGSAQLIGSCPPKARGEPPPLTPALAFSPGLPKKWQHFRDCTWKCFRIESPARAHHTMQVAACMQPVGTNAPWPGPGSRGNCQGPGASVLVNSPKWLPAGIGLVSKERGALYLAQLPFTPQKSVPGVVIATPWQWSPSPPQATTPSSRPLLPE